MPPSPSAFGEAMHSLNSLLEAGAERRRRNLQRLASLTARLDIQDYTPSPTETAPAASRSTPEPMAMERDRDDDESLRSFLPRRADPSAGGDYGGAILERVARNYGLRR